MEEEDGGIPRAIIGGSEEQMGATQFRSLEWSERFLKLEVPPI
jgi:hypothetical protein